MERRTLAHDDPDPDWVGPMDWTSRQAADDGGDAAVKALLS
jgi:hypothetical protein